MSAPQNDKEFLLFVSGLDNDVIDEFSMALAVLNEKGLGFISRVIDVKENPDLAREYKVKTLPTLIVGGKHFVGRHNTKDQIIKLGLFLAEIENKT